MRLFLTLVVGSAAAAVLILFVGSLGQVTPGNPIVAVILGLAFLLLGIGALRGAARFRGSERRKGPPEEVSELDVYFVCTECGTEFKVEKLGELQVPRHCGEPMRVERRPASANPRQ